MAKSKRFHELASRSLAKSLSFRAVILVSDGIITFSLTRQYGIAIGFIVLTNIASIILYYFHERVWNGVHWGKTRI